MQTSATTVGRDSNPLSDTPLRQFKRGTVLSYGLMIYNARTTAGRAPDLTSTTRLFRDDKVKFEGRSVPIEMKGQSDPKAINLMAALSLGSEMEVGDYILEIVVRDNNAKGKQNTAIQYVQFEVIE